MSVVAGTIAAAPAESVAIAPMPAFAAHAQPTVVITHPVAYTHGTYGHPPTYAQPYAQPMTYTYTPGAYTQPKISGYNTQQVGAALDTNHDGTVSQHEIAQADTNHDGRASEVEQLVQTSPLTYTQPYVQPVTYTHAPGAYMQPIITGYTAQQVGAALDTNHDGTASQQELAQADTNHDGQVSASEVKQLVQAAPVTYTQAIPTAGSFLAYPQYTFAPGAYTQPYVAGYTTQQMGYALDTNHDGKISQEELRHADISNDGKVDASEVAAKASKKKQMSKKKGKGSCC